MVGFYPLRTIFYQGLVLFDFHSVHLRFSFGSMRKEQYHGWLIELSSDEAGYSYQCWLPGDRLAVSDRMLYSDLEQARSAAQKRADAEAVRWAIKHCYSTYIQGALSSDEYSTLEDLILGVLTPANRGHALS